MDGLEIAISIILILYGILHSLVAYFGKRELNAIRQAGIESAARIEKAQDALLTRIDKVNDDFGKTIQRIHSRIDRVKTNVDRLIGALSVLHPAAFTSAGVTSMEGAGDEKPVEDSD